MKKLMSSTLAVSAALALTSQPVLAQEQCITEEQVSALVIYAIPLALEAVQKKCAATLTETGFMAEHGDALIEQYAGHSDRTWPDALEIIGVITGGASLSMFEGMDDSVLRPFVDQMATAKITEEIKPENCGKIERMAEAIAPIEPDKIGTLSAVILGIFAKEKAGKINICPVENL